MMPLPLPQAGGSITDLRKYLNVSEESEFVLVVVWLLAALRNTGPYPLMVISGEQGSAKSTFATLLKKISDPNSSPLRTLQRDVRDLFISANNNHVLAYDNLSHLSPWISDALCRISTGGGFSTRQLHTDQDEMLFNSMRPVILNGIDDVVTRPDLADRSIVLTLDPIPEEKRRTEKELMAAFESELSGILGALLDALAHGLKKLPETHLDHLPRMADFALWGKACEGAFWAEGTFIDAYQDNYASTVENVLEANDVASAVQSLLDIDLKWSGTATQLLQDCSEEVSETVRKSYSWPKTPKAMSSQLRRTATFLRKAGIQVEMVRGKDRNRTRTISISRIAANGQESSEPSVGSENSGLTPEELRTLVDHSDDRSAIGGQRPESDNSNLGRSDDPDDDDLNFGSDYQA